MNKQVFLQQLDILLKNFPEYERQDIIQDYEEYFSIGMHEGKTEEQIAAALGSPKQISKELLASYHLEKASSTASTGNILRAVWATIGLGFFNVIIVLAPFVALAGFVLAGWMMGVSFIAAPLLFAANLIFNPDTFVMFDLFASIALCGLGFFIIVGMYFATRSLTNGFVRYLRFNTKLVKGGLKHE